MKKFALALVLVAAVAFAANASAPPAHGGHLAGWGMNPDSWNDASGTFSAWGIYDPLHTGGGGSWVVGYNSSMAPIYINYSPITIELWIEMYSMQTYHYTSYQWHRLGNLAENIEFTVEGTIQSNNGQYVSLTKGTEDLNKLWFKHNIFGGTSPGLGTCDLALTWYGRWGDGLSYGSNCQWPDAAGTWATLTPDPDLTMLIDEVCDHWFQFKGNFSIPYHQPDGYYSLTVAGCPAPML